MSRYYKPPVRMTAKFASACANSKCAAPIAKGAPILYYPAEHKAVCDKCGSAHEREMVADLFDERGY